LSAQSKSGLRRSAADEQQHAMAAGRRVAHDAAGGLGHLHVFGLEPLRARRAGRRAADERREHDTQARPHART
jgi:hypothetical protein